MNPSALRSSVAAWLASTMLVLAGCDTEGSSAGAGGGGAGGSGTGDGGASGQTSGGSGGSDASSTGPGSVTTATGGGQGTASGGTASGGTSSSGDAASSGSGDATSTGTGVQQPCGDGTCAADEDCASCASDCGACATCEGASDATTSLDGEEQAFLASLNAYRAENGRSALAACTSLSRAAQGHSEDMRDQDYFSHDSLDGRSPWERACDSCYETACGGAAMAENIAAGNESAAGTFSQWQSSPGHDANMLGAGFAIIGIGRATGGGQYGSYWTTVFGSSAEASCN